MNDGNEKLNIFPDNQNGKRLDFIDALRGFAILSVIFVHTTLVQFPDLPHWFRFFSSEGVQGVEMFFMISGFSIFYSLSCTHKNENNWRNFFLRRIFRIVPLFYVAILVWAVLDVVMNRVIWIDNIIAHLTLLFGFHPFWINTLVPGGWAIATELLFYVTVPVLFTRIKNMSDAILLTGITVVLSLAFNQFLQTLPLVYLYPEYSDFIFFWLPTQFPFFCCGVVLFFVLKNVIFETGRAPVTYTGRERKIITICCFLIASHIIIFLLLHDVTGTRIVRSYIFGIAFFLFAAGLAFNPVTALVNKFTVYLGKISYSCYLVHMVLVIILRELFLRIHSDISPPFLAIGIFFMLFLVILGLTMLVSSFTYRFIEQPGIAFGKKIIARHT